VFDVCLCVDVCLMTVCLLTVCLMAVFDDCVPVEEKKKEGEKGKKIQKKQIHHHIGI